MAGYIPIQQQLQAHELLVLRSNAGPRLKYETICIRPSDTERSLQPTCTIAAAVNPSISIAVSSRLAKKRLQLPCCLQMALGDQILAALLV